MARSPKLAGAHEGNAHNPDGAGAADPSHPLYIPALAARAESVAGARAGGAYVGRGPRGSSRLKRWMAASGDQRAELDDTWSKQDAAEARDRKALSDEKDKRAAAVGQARTAVQTAGLTAKDWKRFAK